MRQKLRNDVERTFSRVNEDLAYMKRERVTLLRTGAMSPQVYAEEVQRLEGELHDVQKNLVVARESEAEMLKTILDFSELIKMASLYYKYALDQERHEILTHIFTELTLSNDEFGFVPKDAYLRLFQRHDKKKTHHATHDVVSGSGGGARLRLSGRRHSPRPSHRLGIPSADGICLRRSRPNAGQTFGLLPRRQSKIPNRS